MKRPAVLRRAGSVVRRALRAAAADRITTSAGSLAFHSFLAVLTTAVAAVGVIGLVGLKPTTVSRLVHDVRVLVPVQLADTISKALEGTGRSSSGWLAAVLGSATALWSAVEAMASLQVGLDTAYGVTRDVGLVTRRMRGLPLAACTGVLGGAAFGLLVLGNPIRSLLPASFTLAQSASGTLWELVRWLGALVLVMTLLSVYYTFGPNRPRPWRWISPGALIAAAGWMGTSALFSFYLNRFGHESRTYGAFAGVAVLLLWLYLASMAVLLGAEVDRQIEGSGAGPGVPEDAEGRRR